MSRTGSGRFLVDFETTNQLDVDGEPVNDINGDRGQSFLVWLRPRLERGEYLVDEPSTEDWGWYVEVNDETGVRRMVGATAWKREDGTVDWLVQVWRWRTIRQWLRRAPVMQHDDPLLELVVRAVRELTPSEVSVSEQ